jgi:WD40 repeat protein
MGGRNAFAVVVALAATGILIAGPLMCGPAGRSPEPPPEGPSAGEPPSAPSDPVPPERSALAPKAGDGETHLLFRPDRRNPDIRADPIFSTDPKFDPLARPDGPPPRDPSILVGHRYPVYRVAWSGDGKRLISESVGEARVWDVAAGETIRTIVAGREPEDIGGVGLNADGSLAAVFANEAEGALLRRVNVPDGSVQKRTELNRWGRPLSTTADGRLVLMHWLDGQMIRLVDGESGRVRQDFKVGSLADVVTGAAISSDGRTVVVAVHHTRRNNPYECGSIESIPTDGLSTEVRTLVGKCPVFGVLAVSRDSKMIAAADGRRVLIWDAETGARVTSLEGFGEEIGCVDISPDGRLVAAGGLAGSVMLWEIGGEGRTLMCGHAFGVLSIAFSPDSKRLATGSADSTIRLWETGRRTWGQRTAAPVLSAAPSPDGKTVAVGTADGGLEIRDAADGSILSSVPAPPGGGRVWSVAYSADGSALAVGSLDTEVAVRDARTGEPRFSLAGHESWVECVRLSPDGKTFATAGHDDTIRLFSAADGKPGLVLRGHADMVFCLAYSPDGSVLASGSADATVRFWNAATGAEIRVSRFHRREVRAVAYSPDGRAFASGGRDRFVRVIGSGTGEQDRADHFAVATDGDVFALAFSPDGRHLAIGESGRPEAKVRIWSLSDRKDRAVVPAGMAVIHSLSYSPDGRTLIASGETRGKPGEKPHGAVRTITVAGN